MMVDGMTKALARDRHVDLLVKMGIGSIAETAPHHQLRIGVVQMGIRKYYAITKKWGVLK
jgi:hypothetical protein